MPTDEPAKGSNTDFPHFKTGDSAGKILSASYQNKIGSTLERLNQTVFGQGDAALNVGPARFMKGDRRHNTVLVVKVPDDGIPARDGDTLGTAKCDLYLIVDGEDEPEAVLEADLDTEDGEPVAVQVQVYNTSASAIDSSSEYIQIHRTRGGYWLAITGGGGGASIIGFSITEVDCEEEDEHGHHFATATVTYVACGLSSPEVGDEVTVYDLMGCFLEGNSALLLGRQGQAFKAKHETAYETCGWVISAMCSADLLCS